MISFKCNCLYFVQVHRCSSLFVLNFSPPPCNYCHPLCHCACNPHLFVQTNADMLLLFALFGKPSAPLLNNPLLAPAIFSCCTFVFDCDFSTIFSLMCCQFWTDAILIQILTRCAGLTNEYSLEANTCSGWPWDFCIFGRWQQPLPSLPQRTKSNLEKHTFLFYCMLRASVFIIQTKLHDLKIIKWHNNIIL